MEGIAAVAAVAFGGEGKTVEGRRGEAEVVCAVLKARWSICCCPLTAMGRHSSRQISKEPSQLFSSFLRPASPSQRLL